MLSKGETGRVLCVAHDQHQARIQRDYIAGVFDASPMLSKLVSGETADTITLSNGIVIEVRAANFRRLRGATAVAVICSESAFWLDDNSANPDREIIGAVRPALLTTSGPLIQISSPHA
jgi:hypothetical protein